MGNRSRKDDNIEDFRLFSAAGIASRMADVLAVTLSVMCVLLAFYAQDGYNQIGNAKFAVYRVTMLAGFSVFLALGAVYLIFSLREKSGKSDCRLQISVCLHIFFFNDFRLFWRLL